MDNQHRAPDYAWTRFVIVGQLVMLAGYVWGLRAASTAEIIAPSILAGTGFVIAAVGCAWKRPASERAAEASSNQESQAG